MIHGLSCRLGATKLTKVRVTQDAEKKVTISDLCQTDSSLLFLKFFICIEYLNSHSQDLRRPRAMYKTFLWLICFPQK